MTLVQLTLDGIVNVDERVKSMHCHEIGIVSKSRETSDDEVASPGRADHQ